jgi:hypothetical protein
VSLPSVGELIADGVSCPSEEGEHCFVRSLMVLPLAAVLLAAAICRRFTTAART